MHVTALAIAPVKGMRLIPVPELTIGAVGPVGDRAFLVVDEAGQLLVTGRTPELVQVVPSWDPGADALGLRFPDGTQVQAVVERGDAATTEMYDGRPVTGRLVGGVLADALSDHLGRRVRLLARDATQVGGDDAPVTLMSEASAAALAPAPGGTVPDPRRLRITITVAGVAAWEEEEWIGGTVALGDAVLRVTAPVPRCVVITRDPEDGHRDVPALKTLAALRGKDRVDLGVWCQVAAPGRIAVGDALTVRANEARDAGGRDRPAEAGSLS
jgi:uncharacterized protein YcbX